jgi:4-hydroxy-2-oxoglutarate aldolase
VSFSARLVGVLAAHPNIAGIKETSGDVILLETILKERPPTFGVYVGTGSLLYAGLLLGADGGIVALANVAPRQCVALADAIARGRIDEARALQMRFLSLNHAVTGGHGVAGLKHALELLGFRTGPPRPPLVRLDEKAAREVEAAIAEAGLALERR